MKQPSKFTRAQKSVVSANGYNPNEYMFVSETDSYMRIVKKDTIDGNPVIKTIDKHRRKR